MTARVTIISTLFLIFMLPGFLGAQSGQRHQGNGDVELAYNNDDDREHQKHRRKRRLKRQQKARKTRRLKQQERRHQKHHSRHHQVQHHRDRYPLRSVTIHPRHFPPVGYCRVWDPYRAPRHQTAPVPCGQLYGRPIGDAVVVTHHGVSYNWWARHPYRPAASLHGRASVEIWPAVSLRIDW